MQTGPTRANDLLNFFRVNTAMADEETRMDEINQLLSYNKELQKTEEKNSKNNRGTFLAVAGGLLAMGVATLARVVPGLPGNWEVFSVLGYLLLGFAAIFTLSRLQNNPLVKLREKMEQLHARLVLPNPKPKTKGIYKSKKDRIIGGVAAGLARRFGVQPGLIRLLFLALIPISGGTAIMVYLILALGLRFIPEDQEA
jgi:phage shock protein C